MKTLSKNKVIIFILMIIILLSGKILISKNKNLYNNNSHHGVYIYSDWKNNISVSKGDNILVQIPIYDFNNEINLDNVEINLDNLNIGKVEDIDISVGDKYKDFTSYMISFYMIFEETGKYSLDDIIMNISTDKNTYSKSIGEFNIDVYNNNQNINHIEILGGTGLVSKEESVDENNKNTYTMNYKLKNKSNDEIEIKNISLNKSEDMYIEFKDVTIKPNEEKEVEFNYIINNTFVKSSIIEPKIEYTVLGEKYTVSGTQIILAEPLSVDRINELVNQDERD